MEAACLEILGLTLGTIGLVNESEMALQRSLRMFIAMFEIGWEGVVNSLLAQLKLWSSEPFSAIRFADRAKELAPIERHERDFIRSSRLQGLVALGLKEFPKADEQLHYGLTRARQVNLAEEELPALVALAELGRQEGKQHGARELLDDVWDSAERGPYPLFHADAFNVLAQIERDAGNRGVAVEAATQAYRLAWCDGPPYAYHWGLEAARKHLLELGAPEPEMPPFDPSKYEPMPEVEIDPEDEFHVGMQT
jgi:hypothetical protein